MKPTFMDPVGVHTPPRPYSHVVLVPAAEGHTRVLVSGQVSLDAEGKIVGPNDIRAQVPMVYANVTAALKGAGADWRNVVFLRTFLADPADLPVFNDLRDAFFSQVLPDRAYPASTLVVVRSLFRPELRLEIDAEAFV